MSAHAFDGATWRKAKVVWWWDGASWHKAVRLALRTDTWFMAYSALYKFGAVSGVTDSATAPANVTLSWNSLGQKYGNTVTVNVDGVGYSTYDLEANPNGVVVSGVDPTAVFQVVVRDGNNDVIWTKTATISGP